MDIKTAQTAVIQMGLKHLYTWLGGKEPLFAEETGVGLPPCIAAISSKISGSSFFDSAYRCQKEEIRSIFSEVNHVPGYRREAAYTVSRPVITEELPYAGDLNDVSWKEEAREQIERYYERLQDSPEAILVLLEKYGSFVRAGIDDDHASVSLFELTRCLAALAYAEDQDEPYLLVSSDFSGIQKIIYTIASKGALKSLRGRSFFLELLNQHIISEILGRELTSASIVHQGGGGFILLLPNTSLFSDRLKRLKARINEWLLDEFQGKLYVGLCWLPVKPDEVMAGKFQNKWDELGKLLGRDKARRFSDRLDSLLAVSEPEMRGKEDECQICHRDDRPEKEMTQIRTDPGEEFRACPLCYKLYRTGDKLTDFRYIWMSRNKEDGDDCDLELPALDSSDLCYYRFAGSRTAKGAKKKMQSCVGMVPSEKIQSMNRAELRLLKNSFDIADYLDGRTRPFLYADYVISEYDIDPTDPSKKTTTANFGSLAGQATGKHLIGSLRMDVDHLGVSFSCGISEGRFDLMRYSALSRQIGHFFTIYLNLICEGVDAAGPCDVMGTLPARGRRFVSVIYAGGDDLFITGAWSDIVELACDIARNFKRYVGGSDDFSISGGVVLTKPDFPIYQMARLSGEAEEKAKKHGPPCGKVNCSSSYEKCPIREEDGGDGRCRRNDAGLLFYIPARDLRLSTGRNSDSCSRAKGPELKTAFQWEEIEGVVIPLVKLFCALRKQDVAAHLEFQCLPGGFVHRLFGIIEAWEEEGILYLPLLHYMISRMREAISSQLQDCDPSKEDLRGKILELLGQSGGPKGMLLDQRTINTLWISLTWITFLSRQEEQPQLQA